MALAELEQTRQVDTQERCSKVWDRVVIDFPGRRVIADEREVGFKGEINFWMFAHLANNGSQPTSKAELELVAREAGSQKQDPAGSSIPHLRNLFGDSDNSLIRGSAREGWSLGAREVEYVAFQPREFGWQKVCELSTSPSIALSCRGPMVQEVPGGLKINGGFIPCGGKHRELVMAIPNTGEHVISLEDLALTVYGDRNRTRGLVELISVTNGNKLRAKKFEITGLRAARAGGKEFLPVIGYYLRALDEVPPKRERVRKPDWRLKGFKRQTLRAFENFARWCSSPIPHWPTLLEGAVSGQKMHFIRRKGKPIHEAYTPEEFSRRVGKVYDRLAVETSHIDLWTKAEREAWDNLQRRFNSNSRKTDTEVKERIRRLIDVAWTDYQITLRHRNNLIS